MARGWHASPRMARGWHAGLGGSACIEMESIRRNLAPRAGFRPFHAHSPESRRFAVLMFFFYLSAFLFILGAIVSSVVARRFDPAPEGEP